MAIEMPDRLKQIAVRFEAGETEKIIYTPSDATVRGTQINYNGYAATIKGISFLESLPEAVVPLDDPTDSTLIRQQKAALFNANPHKRIMLYLRDSSNNEFELAYIDFYHVIPFYMTSINPYFASLELYGIEYDWQLIGRQIDAGSGLLTGQEFITITGYVVERAAFLQDDDLTVYNYIGV